MESIINLLNNIIDWANGNSGFVSVLIFIITVIFGWLSGIFSGLMKKPKLSIKVLDGPSMCVLIDTGKEQNGKHFYRTCISLYLTVTNTGSSATDILEINLGYHNSTNKYFYLWYWGIHMVVSLTEFKYKMGEYIKVFPLLIQSNSINALRNDTYLEIGKSATGVVYFEDSELSGKWLPKIEKNKLKIKVRITDAFGKYHYSIVQVPIVGLEEARKYNAEFGNTISQMSGAKNN